MNLYPADALNGLLVICYFWVGLTRLLLLIYYDAVTGRGLVSFPTSDVDRKSLAFGFYFTIFV